MTNGRVRHPCAGGVVFDARGRLLLVLRANEPAAGTWSLPGGRCLPGEDPAAACVREVREETGREVRVVRHAGRVLRDAPGGGVYVIDDYLCALADGESEALRPGDDAPDARWVTAAELDTLPLAPLLRETLAGWGLVPA